MDTLGDVGGGVPSGVGQPRPAPAAPQRASRPAPLAPHAAVGEAALGQAAVPGPSLPAGLCAQDQAPVPLKGNGGLLTTRHSPDTVEAWWTGVTGSQMSSRESTCLPRGWKLPAPKLRTWRDAR